VGVVAGDVGAVGVDAVAQVGVPRVHRLLRAVLGDREAAEVGAVRPELGGPVEQVEGDAGLCAAELAGVDPRVHALAGAGAGGDPLEVPVAAVVVGVWRVAVGVGGVAAVAVERQAQVGDLRGAGEGGAVNVGVDGVDVGRGVHADDGGGEAAFERLQQEA